MSDGEFVLQIVQAVAWPICFTIGIVKLAPIIMRAIRQDNGRQRYTK